MSTYQDYMFGRHSAQLEKDPNYILEIPVDELSYELCCVAVKKAAGDCTFFQFILNNYPQYVDENLCKIAVGGIPKGECVREETESVDMPEGDEYYTVEILQYPDPILKYVPEKFRTEDVCRVAVTHDWRSLEFVPVRVQLTASDIWESAVNNCDKMMETDVIYYRTGKSKKDKVFSWLSKSVFETNPDIFNGEYTLKYVSYKWKLANKDKIVELLSKWPSKIEYLSKKFRKQAFDVIRRVAEQQPDIICYLSKDEQNLLHDLIKEHLVNGRINLGAVCAPVQMLMPDVCVAKLTSDPYETRYLTKSWADEPTPGLNLDYLCKELQKQNVELISRLVCEQIELLECVKNPVLFAHPEICSAVIEKYGAVAFDKIPKGCFTKYPYLYEKLLQKCPEMLPDLPKRYQKPARWRVAIEKVPGLVKVAPVGCITEADCVRAFALPNQNILLSSVPPKFRTYNVCKIALERYTGNITYVPEQVKKAHFDVCEMVVEKDAANIKYVPESIQLKHPELCKRAVTDDPMTLGDVKPSVQRKYPEICRLAVAQNVANYLIEHRYNPVSDDRVVEKKGELYPFISPDVLKKHWDDINNIESVITVVNYPLGR